MWKPGDFVLCQTSDVESFTSKKKLRLYLDDRRDKTETVPTTRIGNTAYLELSGFFIFREKNYIVADLSGFCQQYIVYIMFNIRFLYYRFSLVFK